MMKTKYGLFLKLIGSLFALALLAAPSLGVAQITITQVDVIVGGQHFCDTNTSCGNQIWTLPGGSVTLNPGQTLILTQTGTMVDVHGGTTGGNFDTSDRGPQLSACTSANPCTVQLFLAIIGVNGGLLTSVYNSVAPVPLNNFNLEPDSTPSASHNEASIWMGAVNNSTYTVQFGYADNEHSDACVAGDPLNLCFPQATFGTGGATFFIGAGLADSDHEVACGDPGHPYAPAPGGGCYDAGALLITALAPPPVFQGCTPGYWKQSQHFGSWKVYTPSTTVGSVFTFPAALNSFASETFLVALQGGGGPGVNGAVQILLRAAVAALLNAANNNITYPLTTASIISQVNTALGSQNRDTILVLATQLDNDNNLGCPLN